MAEIPSPPLPPTRPPKRTALLPIVLALVVGLMLLITLSLMSFGFAALVAVVALSVFGLIGFHYVCWGWWLGNAIRRDLEMEEADGKAWWDQ